MTCWNLIDMLAAAGGERNPSIEFELRCVFAALSHWQLNWPLDQNHLESQQQQAHQPGVEVGQWESQQLNPHALD